MKNIFKDIKAKVNDKAIELSAKTHALTHNKKGEFYIDKTVGIIIAVVVGALLMGIVYTFISTNVDTQLSTEIGKLWGYTGN